MIITRATEYSIRAVLHLADQYPAAVISKQEICEKEGITPAFLTKILQPLISTIEELKKALARDPAKLTLVDVMQAVDEPMALNVCLLEGHACERECTCPVHDMWAEAKSSFEQIFSRHTVADLARMRHSRESGAAQH